MKLEAWLEAECKLRPLPRLLRFVRTYCAMFGKEPDVLIMSSVYSMQFSRDDISELESEHPRMSIVIVYIEKKRRMHEPGIILSDALNTRQLVI